MKLFSADKMDNEGLKHLSTRSTGEMTNEEPSWATVVILGAISGCSLGYCLFHFVRMLYSATLGVYSMGCNMHHERHTLRKAREFLNNPQCQGQMDNFQSDAFKHFLKGPPDRLVQEQLLDLLLDVQVTFRNEKVTLREVPNEKGELYNNGSALLSYAEKCGKDCTELLFFTMQRAVDSGNNFLKWHHERCHNVATRAAAIGNIDLVRETSILEPHLKMIQKKQKQLDVLRNIKTAKFFELRQFLLLQDMLNLLNRAYENSTMWNDDTWFARGI